jgi:hypothetical protein
VRGRGNLYYKLAHSKIQCTNIRRNSNMCRDWNNWGLDTFYYLQKMEEGEERKERRERREERREKRERRGEERRRRGEERRGEERRGEERDKIKNFLGLFFAILKNKI